MNKRGWQFWIDRGGTFTDVIGEAPDGALHVRKLLSENPQRYADAAVAGIKRILDAEDDRSGTIDAIKMGTTVATNALLERGGEPTVLLITKGFGDALAIGYQNRPEIFAQEIVLPKRLHGVVVEVAERVDAQGEILQVIETEALEAALRDLRAEGYRACAICFMHAYRFAEHERIAGDLARHAGFEQVSMSHEVSPLRKLIGRGDTTVADAYLSPVLARHIQGLRSGLAEQKLAPTQLMFMQSNGGLVGGRYFRGKDSILSGPAGGVVGMVGASREVGGDQLIGFDMGGTSTDVSLYAGEFEFVNHTEIAGVRIRAPMIRVHTIAAGGGSILKFESGRFQVGPESAGAYPGPASYRNDGPLTITDANIMLGKIQPRFFASVFGARGDEALDSDEVARRFAALAKKISQETRRKMRPEDVAEGFIHVAVDNMANAIKRVSIQRGHDPREFTLCCFGGAGGQHACRVADQLGIETILIHPLAGVLSAYGMGVAPLRAYRQHAVGKPLTASVLEALRKTEEELGQQCTKALYRQGVAPEACRLRSIFEIKVAGSDTTLPVDRDELPAMHAAFREAHANRFGFNLDDDELYIESFRIEVVGQETPADYGNFGGATVRADPPRAAGRGRLFYRGEWREMPAYVRDALATGFRIAGPALVVDATSTTVVEPGWQMEVDKSGHLVLTRADADERGDVDRNLWIAGSTSGSSAGPNPVLMEVFNSHFMNIAEQMGSVLENTAHSVNIKERLDFSCALFDRSGNLIANAPHIPVHLGAMGDSVRAVLADNAATIKPGDVYMLNSPYNGGSHLPDVTVITPIFEYEGNDENQNILFVVACRAHHADIGGITPGSMPPGSRSIEEEGVLFDNFQLVTENRFREQALRRCLAEGPFPARSPDQNIADLRAQVAANAHGQRALGEMTAHFGLDTVLAYMDYIQANAEESIRSVIDELDDGEFLAEMDGGEQVHVRITVDHRRREALIDFTGTSSQSAANLNAPISVTRAAVLYVFRSLIRKNIPLNAGCLKPLRLLVPENCLLNPRPPAAVVAGNVETSQCVTNALYGALKVQASSQSTMNNLTFGDDRYQYYETICGGSGAGKTFDGTDAVHTHMTNSRMTDPEVLEARFPIIIRSFAIRANSGGGGKFRGGNGVVRRIEFRQPMQAAIVSNNRRVPPFGLCGGEPGAPGLNYVLRASGAREKLGGTDEIRVEAGDILVIETPGGGGYGAVP